MPKLYQAGITREDFITCDEEFDWISYQISKRKVINPRVFKRRFPDFEWLPPQGESLIDLLEDLKAERAFVETVSLVENLSNELSVENAIERARFAREQLGQITRTFDPVSDVNLIGDWRDHYESQKALRLLREGGQAPGIPTGSQWLDFHWDGLVPGRMIIVLGRPGDGKSYLIMSWVWHAIKNQYKVLFFSPEMSKHEHTCRLHTLASADPDVKKELGLRHSFRNRALMNGLGFNMKSYRQFCEWMNEGCEEVVMPKPGRAKITPGFIEAKIEEHQPALVVIDPIYKVKGPITRKSNYEELSDVSDMIQDLAESYNVPIVVSNQAHRQQSKKEDAPHKDSSFGSDVPIQEADHAVGVKHISEEHRMIVRCTKSRFGQDFRFELVFFPNTGVMRELDAPSGSYYNGNDEDADEEELRQIIETVKGSEQHADKQA